MKTVYKYGFSMKTSKFSLLLPVGFKFLSVMFQDEKPQMWCEVVDGVTKEQYDFALFGTGQEIPISAEYLTTFSVGPFIFHLYRVFAA